MGRRREQQHLAVSAKAKHLASELPVEQLTSGCFGIFESNVTKVKPAA
jgi:hypothetical protein